MATAKATKRAAMRFDDFVEVATDSALRVIVDQQRTAGPRFNPRIWVGIWVDPFTGGPRGPIGGTGPQQ